MVNTSAPLEASHFDIAIDGPVAAGKGTVSKRLADRLGFLYVDTGAMYRMATLLAVRAGIALDAEADIVELVKQTQMTMRPPSVEEQDGRLATIFMNGEDVTTLIRTVEISAATPSVAKLAKVREALVEKQQLIARDQDVVMEGRDITTVVLPDAKLKIYLTADEEVRVQRRFEQLQKTGNALDLEVVRQQLKDRDYQDMHRAADPLTIAPDAWILDTSKLSIAEVVAAVVERVTSMRLASQ